MPLLRLWVTAFIAVVLVGCAGFGTRGTEPPLEVSITTHLGDAQVFRAGDPLSFFISLASDAHVLLLYEDAGGEVSQIVPNARFDRSYVQAGDFISMPPPDADFRLRVSSPFGLERVWLIASEKPLPRLTPEPGKGVLNVRGSVASIRKQLQSHASRNGARYGEASVSITTQPN